MRERSRRPATLVGALRSAALRHPGTAEGVACEGTSLEKRTIRVGKKAFLFLGASDAMLKLGDSLAEARRVASEAPDRCRAGAGGWVQVKFGEGAPLPLELLRRWVDESYRLFAPASASAPRPPARRSAKGR